MRFRRKRERWGVEYHALRGSLVVLSLGSRRRAESVAAQLASVFPDIRPVRLPRG